MKRVVILILILIIIPLVSAIKITEVELNPADDCKDCTEWAEIYSENEINLNEYWIENSKSKKINLSGSGQGYIKIEFGKQFLTNSGDKLILKKSDILIDETEIFEDSDNDKKTWQLCENSWEFKESTKGKENNCEEAENENSEITETQTLSEDEEDDEKEQEDDNEDSDNRDTESERSNPSVNIVETKKIENEIIILSSKDIKTNGDSSNQDKNKKAFYGLAIFCGLLLCLFFVQRRKKDGIE
jgi:hypothetical protein